MKFLRFAFFRTFLVCLDPDPDPLTHLNPDPYPKLWFGFHKPRRTSEFCRAALLRHGWPRLVEMDRPS